jgi:hypothetical protein
MDTAHGARRSRDWQKRVAARTKAHRKLEVFLKRPAVEAVGGWAHEKILPVLARIVLGYLILPLTALVILILAVTVLLSGGRP